MQSEKSEKIVKKLSSKKIWRGPIAWMVQNTVAANLLMFSMLIGGCILLSSMHQEIMPPVETDTVTISLTLEGANPEEMEKSMVQVVESNVRDVENVDEISSTVRNNGYATVSVTMIEGANRDRFLQDIQNEVTRIRSFPDEAETPVVTINKRSTNVMSIIIYGSNDVLFLQEWAEIVKDELIAKPNITQVDIDNNFDREIQIEISQNTLRKYGLTLDEVASTIRNSSIQQSAGDIETVHGDITINFDDRKDYAQEFGQIAILSPSDGSRLLLSDMADIKETFTESRAWANYNNSAALLIDVSSTGNQTPADVAREAQEVIEDLNTRLPGGLQLKIQSNYADDFAERGQMLIENAVLGIVLVFICLSIFLQPKLAFWVSLGIPTAILGSFLFLSPYGSSVNMITMFAFILTLGIVVDDAIVVGENIHIWRRKGYSRAEAAVLGTREIVTPVVFSVLTNIVAFTPIIFLPGQMGNMFGAIVPVITIVFACSLIESIFVLPCHLAHETSPQKDSLTFRISARQRKFSAAFTKLVEKYYGPLIYKIYDNRYVIVTICFCLLAFASSYSVSGRMRMGFMQSGDQDYAYFFTNMPTGTSEKVLREVEERVVNAAQKVINENGGEKLASGVYISVRGTFIGGRIYLTDENTRPLTTSQVTSLWRQETGVIKNAESFGFQSNRGMAGSGKDLTIRLAHRDNDTLQKAAEDLADALENYPILSEIETGTSETVKEYTVKISPTGEKLGFTSSQVSQQVRSAFEGISVLTQQRGRDEVTVRLRLPEKERENESSFVNLVIRTPENEEVFLRDIVQIEATNVPSSIYRIEGQKTLQVSAKSDPSTEAAIVYEELNNDFLLELVGRYPGLTWSKGGNLRDIDDSMDALIQSLLFVMFAIYVLLAIPFKSYTQPFIIMIAVPFAIIGAIGGHYIMGHPLGVVSFLGVLALCGLVVNDSLVLIDFANKEMRKGADARTAMYFAGIRRFRPIMLTTLTTFIGLSPMLLETSQQAVQMIPVAISLAFGIVFATVITLALVPALYIIFDDFKSKKSG